MRRTKYPELKAELKTLAKEIRYYKDHRKLPKRREIGLSLWQIESHIGYKKYEFRHRHIAYCMLRGRKYEEIERYTRELPDFKFIEEVMEHNREAVCLSAERSE